MRVSFMPCQSVAKYAFLLSFFVMTFRTFQYFPGMLLLQELWFGLCVLFLIVVYPFWKANRAWKISSFECYLIALITIVPILSAVSAQREFGQPLIYGLLSQRNVTVIAGLLLYVHAARHRLFELREIENSLLMLAWGTLILFTIIRIVLDPSEFHGYGIGFVTGSGKQAAFKLPAYFIIFGVFYYAFRGFRTRRTRDYLLAILLLAGAVGNNGSRAMIVAVLVSFLFFICRWGNARRLFTSLPKMLVGLALVVGLLYFAMPEATADRFDKFRDAFTVALTGSEVEDVSANARILEVLAALPRIEKHPVLGSGILSNQWHGGNESVLGEYFHPSDIGLLGALYSFGLFGVMLFGWQYRFALRAVKNLPAETYIPFVEATKGFLVFIVFTSISTGAFVFNAEVSLVFIALLRSTANYLSCFETAGKILGEPCSRLKLAL